MPKKNSVAVLLASLCLATSSLAAAHPNILLILVDDMGYGDAGCYNPDSRIPTPNIDSLARDGMRFTDAHAAGSVCHPSRYGLMTGQHPWRVNTNVWRKQPVIAEGRMTVASLLRSQGYRTAMVGKWHLGFAENGYENPLPGGPVDRGFDSYFGIRASTDIPPYFYIRGNKAVAPPTDTIAANYSEDGWTRIQGAFWREGGIAPGLELKNVLPRFTDEACDVIRKHGKSDSKKPLFLYLAYPAPHTPWLPTKNYNGKSRAGMYGDFAFMVDDMVGRVLKTLDKAGMADDTLVILSSDNGPVWYDKDVKRYGHDSVGGLRGMKGDAWEAGHRMPFLVRWPGQVKAGSVSDQTIGFTDMLATFAAITGAKLPMGAGPDSFNILPVLKGTHPKDKPIRGPLVNQASRGSTAIRSGKWKLITSLGSGGFSEPRNTKPTKGGPKGQLYDMSKDRNETTNLWQKHPDVVARLQAELKQIKTAEQTRP